MQNNIVFVSNCDLYKDLTNTLLDEDTRLIDYYFSCCDAANLLQSRDIELFIIAHEFIEDSIEDYQDYLNLYQGQSSIKPVLFCDEFEIEQAQHSLQEQLVKDIIIARPLSDKVKLLALFTTAITKAKTKSSNSALVQTTTSTEDDNSPSILVIEDDAFFSEVYQSSLAQLDMKVIVVADCNSASEAIYQNKPRLIFLDYNLPDFNGFEFLQSIKSDPSLTEIPVIVVTGESDPELNRRSHQIGATKFLKKPLKATEITTIASVVLREQQLVRS